MASFNLWSFWLGWDRWGGAWPAFWAGKAPMMVCLRPGPVMGPTRFVAAGLLAAAALDASAQDSRRTYSLAITGHVPEVCSAQVSSSQVSVGPGVTPIGRLTEFCNVDRPFQVWADFPPALAGSTLLVNGAPVSLPAAGTALIDSGSGPLRTDKSLSIDAPGPVQGHLTIRVACGGGAC